MKHLRSEPTLQFIQPWHRLRPANKVRLHWVANAMGLKLAQVCMYTNAFAKRKFT